MIDGLNDGNFPLEVAGRPGVWVGVGGGVHRVTTTKGVWPTTVASNSRGVVCERACVCVYPMRRRGRSRPVPAA